MTLREKIARIVWRKMRGSEYTGANLLSEPAPYACYAVGAAEAILSLLTKDEETVERVARGIRRFVSEAPQFERQLPAGQFVANRDDAIARAALASLGEVGEK